MATAETGTEDVAEALYNISAVYPGISNETIHVAHHVEYTDPEILAVLAMGAVGFILNIAVISIASRRPAFFQVPVKSLVISLGSANLFIITFCMTLNAAWHSLGFWFGSDCRFFKTMEAFSLNAAAYIVVAWAVDRCRSCMVYSTDKITGDHSNVRKPRHLTKLVIATWTLAVLLAIQHVIVMPLEQEVIVNATASHLRPAKMACVSRGLFSPPWKQMVVEFISVATTFLIPVTFIVGCLAALMVNYFRRLRKQDPDHSQPIRRFHSYDEEVQSDSKYISVFTTLLAVIYIALFGPYFFSLVVKISGWVDVDVSTTTIFYLVGLSYALVSPILYLILHCCRDPTKLARSSSTIRERIGMLQQSELTRPFDDL
ncbi:hypothetical protein BV898_10223 [Hypsibius exemplaris]|uniref:G-protein coupled receptors family 1 profile domain-containing protein n=1 Tax=Hypsibius exemplaris TaxID=2072580 RepID=A0A1W0WKA8_HYPEX|nr:hypothetical protein BV898_10223 [Hypsibius exemplaris]